MMNSQRSMVKKILSAIILAIGLMITGGKLCPVSINNTEHLFPLSFIHIDMKKLADNLCVHYNFFDPLGKKQLAGCINALRDLER